MSRLERLGTTIMAIALTGGIAAFWWWAEAAPSKHSQAAMAFTLVALFGVGGLLYVMGIDSHETSSRSGGEP